MHCQEIFFDKLLNRSHDGQVGQLRRRSFKNCRRQEVVPSEEWFSVVCRFLKGANCPKMCNIYRD